MRYLKTIALIFIQIAFLTVCFSQREKIDSLKNLLLIAKGIERINCLNTLSNGYYEKEDTALIYAAQAYNEAQKINYLQGMADAMFNKGKRETAYNISARKQYYFRAIELYKKCNNTDTLGQVYFQLGWMLMDEANSQAAIDAFKKAEQLYLQAEDSSNWGITLTFLGLAYGNIGDFTKAFEYGYHALEVRQKTHDSNGHGVLWALSNLGRLFQEVEDYQTAIDYYYNKVQDYAKQHQLHWRAFYDKISECYWLMHQNDSALYFMQKHLSVTYPDGTALERRLKHPGDADFSHEHISAMAGVGLIYLIKNEFDKVLENCLPALKNRDSANLRQDGLYLQPYIVEAYIGKGDYTNALAYARQLLNLAESTGEKQYIRDGTKLIWKIFEAKNSSDSAYTYYRKYTVMKDSISSYRFLNALSGFKQSAENERKELAYQQQLQKEAFTKKILAISIIVIVLIGLFVFTVISLKRKNEAHQREILQSEFQIQKLENEKQLSGLEMQVLRAQMNPHFIFNSLNSINRFILKNNKTEASGYLTKFSRLVRMILQNSQASLITLEIELESLELYLSLEVLRFDYHFGYKISLEDNLDVSVLKIPPLIIQPYVENAIWHGLMHKEEKGLLTIEVTQKDSYLTLKVVDNGIGRKKALELTSKTATKHKSMGLQLTANRIAMLQHTIAHESTITINDLVEPDGSAAGTEVIIKIPIIYD